MAVWIYPILFNSVYNLIWFAFGIWGLVEDRALGHITIMGQNVDNSELEWGSGQLILLIFCVLPFLAVVESAWGMCLFGV